ncbi:MAG: hypothetical protein NTV86_14875 [Planctomycetota bacterium]|nr:hypothetical protein [Planctomycetota bacterium]
MKTKELLKKIESFGLKKYPVGFWNYTNLREHGEHFDEREMDSLVDGGFTLTQTPNLDPSNPAEVAQTRRLLDWAAERDMKLIPRDPRCMAESDPTGKLPKEGFRERAKAAIKDFGDHPANFGFYVGDEGTNDGMYECHRIQKELAPHLNPYYNLLPHFPGFNTEPGWAGYLDEFVAKCHADLLSYDCYAQMTMGTPLIDDYFRNLRLYREAALRNGVPFWNTPLSIGHNQYTCPDYNDIRWQFNTSVCCGAHGIIWFFHYQPQLFGNYRLAPVDELWEKTQTFYDLRRVQRTFHRYYGDLFNRLACTKVGFYPKPFGGGVAWAPDDIVANIWPAYDESTPILVGEFVDAQNRRYVMFVNNSRKAIDRVKITFRKNVKLFSWGVDGQERPGGAYACEGGPIMEPDGLVAWHWLAPGQEAVYRVEVTK